MWYNPIMRFILLSPLHSLVSKGTLLLSYQGQVSGKTYQVPVSYVRHNDQLYIMTFRQRTWWRNFREETPVIVYLEGRRVHAMAKATYQNSNTVARELGFYLNSQPRLARILKVDTDDDDNFLAEDLARAAENRVMVRIRFQPA